MTSEKDRDVEHASAELRRKIADESLAEVEPLDFVRFGLIPEFVGRFPVAVPLRSLSEAELKNVLLGPRNAVGRQFQKLVHAHSAGGKLEFSDGALRELARAALRRETGARGLRSLVERVLHDALFVLPEYAGEIDRVVVDAEGVLRALAPRGIAGGPDGGTETDVLNVSSVQERHEHRDGSFARGRERIVGGARLVFVGDEGSESGSVSGRPRPDDAGNRGRRSDPVESAEDEDDVATS